MGRKKEAKQLAADAVAAFDIKASDLPPAIAEAAMLSGHYPYAAKMKRRAYDATMAAMQIELQKLKRWVAAANERVVIVFEGRDAAGKGGAITRFTQHLNPRQVRIVALPKPTPTEAGQWYFQRYVSHMPSAGEIVLFDRSWYNRAGVERVMGFADADQVEQFLREAPAFEQMLVRDGIRFIKIFLTIGREMQLSRLHARYHDPLKQWKLSPIDFEAAARFDIYSQAIEEMLRRTDTDAAPWTVIRANDKLRARLEVIRRVLGAMPYEGKDEKAVGMPDPRIVVSARTFLANGGEEELQA